MAAVEDELAAGTSKLSVEEIVQRGAALKEEGNVCFKNQNYRKAMRNYHKALLHVKGITDLPLLVADHEHAKVSDELKEKIYQIQFSCYNNLAACLLKDNRWDRVKTYCNEALKLQPQNAKALFRRGQAYFYLRNLEKAEEDLKAAQKLEPKDPNVKKMLSSLDVELKKVKEKEKKIYAEMFAQNSQK